MLVNENGDYLQAPDPRHEWGWLLDHERSFRADYPNAWEQRVHSQSDDVEVGEKRFRFQRVPLGPTGISSTASEIDTPAGSESLILVAYVSETVANAHSRTLLRQLLLMFTCGMAVVGLLTFYWARSAVVRENHETTISASESRLRKLSMSFLTAQESERRNLSRNLHDDLGQQVTAILLDLRSLQRQANDGRDQSLLERAIEETDDLLANVHLIATRVRPSVLDDLGLRDAVESFLATTHKELGDVTGGREVTLGNFYEIFDGLLTGEQMEGLKELLRPSPTTWFNHTTHRVTLEPSVGVSCFSCHVNGHTNGAIELAPDSRPNEARLRVDTPTMRGNYNLMQLSSKRSIRSMDHFAEVEEYFDGDPALQQAIGPRGAQRQITNRMGDFNALLDYPPAPKLTPLMTLDTELATEQELRGERLFHGKAQCAKCHYGPAFVDDYMHDLRVERFYRGRPEGPIKTFPLRGIKDSPPYLHDGRCPTLHDTVEFFNLIFQLGLGQQEKEDLVAYLLCL